MSIPAGHTDPYMQPDPNLDYYADDPRSPRRTWPERVGLSPRVDKSIFTSLVLLLIRLGWGWELVESGYGHLTHIAQTVDAFKGWGVPYPELSVHISACTELIGGILIMLGLATRFISIPLIVNFITAYATASRDEFTHLFKQDPSHIVDDSAFPFLVTSLLMLAFGAGMFSLDYLIVQLRRKRTLR
jgi:putative oxidoreductase